jgi:hypothetical protein
MTNRPELPIDPLAVLVAQVDRDGVYWRSSTDTRGAVLASTHLQMYGGRAGIITDMSPPFYDQVLSDVLITVMKGDKSVTMWGVRRHQLINPRCIRVRVVDSTRPGNPTNMKEHAIYDEIHSGEAIYEGCSGKNIPAQLLQIRLAGNRGDPKWSFPRKIVVNNIHGEEIGQLRGAGRAAFAVSIKDSGPEGVVEMFSPYLRTVQQSQVAKRSDGTWADSFAAVCIEYCKSFTWRHGYIGYKNPKMDSVQLFDYANKSRSRTGPEQILIEGVHFDYGNSISLRLDDTTTKVDIRNCTGSGEIKIYKIGADGIYRISSRLPIAGGFSF